MYQCANVQMSECADVLMCMYQCADVPIANVRLCDGRDVVGKCADARMYKDSGI